MNLYDVNDNLREEVTRRFSRSYAQVTERIMAAAKQFEFDISHCQGEAGITDDELAVISEVCEKLKYARMADDNLCRKQDLILRCLHPDGWWFNRIPKASRLKAFAMVNIDPADGVSRLQLGTPCAAIDNLFDFLSEEVRKVDSY